MNPSSSFKYMALNWAQINIIIYIELFLGSTDFHFSFLFFFFLFMSDAHHGINSSTQKYQSTPSSVVLTSCRQDSGSPPF